ncbi:hypothetical protein E4P41_16850 [Geodermatophilus sp. DF01-2]|uniref:hypothetical protein n=1 Tax=Geodermatophilus sp. DF01-2 TaxID=2559610 RepID=UPI001073A3A4|nr:hypothetical protein [Geodermatophilus sp. DF01_2]TFV55693.1 hypothetical protein E4P41_16850 [Geodermatophilus sp. DF01_2]
MRGEWLTFGLLERAVRLLTTAMTYEVPLQDLGVDTRSTEDRPAHPAGPPGVLLNASEMPGAASAAWSMAPLRPCYGCMTVLRCADECPGRGQVQSGTDS